MVMGKGTPAAVVSRLFGSAECGCAAHWHSAGVEPVRAPLDPCHGREAALRAHRSYAAAAVIGVLLAAGVSGCSSNQGAGAGVGPGTPTDELTIYVYDGVPQLHPVRGQVAGEGDVNDAVYALVSYPADGRFDTLWNGPCALGKNPSADAVEVTEDLITVHFSDPAAGQCDLSPEAVEMRRQQLAWTVRTATGSDAPVQVTVGEEHDRVEGPVVADEKYLAPVG
jgi:hypothetical protein